jgi:hypothetical protein
MSDMRRTRQPRGEAQGRVTITPAVTASWEMSLRCYRCDAMFFLKGIPSASLVSIADSTVCPACGAISEPYVLGTPGLAKSHLIVKLEKDRE